MTARDWGRLAEIARKCVVPDEDDSFPVFDGDEFCRLLEREAESVADKESRS